MLLMSVVQSVSLYRAAQKNSMDSVYGWVLLTINFPAVILLENLLNLYMCYEAACTPLKLWDIIFIIILHDNKKALRFITL